MNTSSMAGTLVMFALAVANEFCRVRKWSLSTTGLRAVKDANFFKKMADGNSGFTPERYDRAIMWFLDNWPPGAVWPARPAWPYGRPAGDANGKASEEAGNPARASSGGTKAQAGTAKKAGGAGKRQRAGAQPKRRRNTGELPTAS